MLDKRLNGLCWFHKFFCKEIYIHANHVLRLQNIHIVGTPFLDPRLREGPMNSVPYVCTSVIQYLKIGSLVSSEIWQEGSGQ